MFTSWAQETSTCSQLCVYVKCLGLFRVIYFVVYVLVHAGKLYKCMHTDCGWMCVIFIYYYF